MHKWEVLVGRSLNCMKVTESICFSIPRLVFLLYLPFCVFSLDNVISRTGTGTVLSMADNYKLRRLMDLMIVTLLK